MSPGRSSRKAVTPESVKVLMLFEAGIISFLSYWVLNEYFYNAYFRTYLDEILLSHVTTYSAILGLGIGLAGSTVAALLYKNLQHAKIRLEAVVAPKIRGAVEKIVSSVPGPDLHSVPSTVSDTNQVLPEASVVTPQTTAIVPLSKSNDSKKQSE